MAKDNRLIGLVFGQYEIVDFIGKGGMATVYKGMQRNVRRTVAIKVLPRNFTHDDTFMTRFRREADLVATLEHPHIMPIYDYGEYDDMPYLVMRYVDGGSLHERVRARTLSFEDIARITRQIGGALDYAHKHNVLHRDVKPSNVMLDSQGNAYLTDFGLARLGDSSTGSLTGSNIVGTPAYIAPEQAEQGPQMPAMDIYSLGVSVFEMLTGQIPYMADTPIAQILAHVQRPIPSVRMFNMSVPPQADRVIQKAMAKRPEDRYKTATQLAMALEAALTGPMAEDVGFLEVDQIPDHPTPIMLDPIPDIDFVVVPDPRTEPFTPKPSNVPPLPDPLLAPVVDTPDPNLLSQSVSPSVVAEREHGFQRNRGRILAIVVLVGLVAAILVILNGMFNGQPTASITPEPTEQVVSTPTEEQVAIVPTDETDTPTSTDEPTPTASDAPTDAPTDDPTANTTDDVTLTLPPPTNIAPAIVLKGVDMLLVKEGLFIMGSRVGQRDEAPEHQVYLDTFYIDRTEVSIEDYMACVAEGSCVDPAIKRSRTRSVYYGLDQYQTYPVINVTWEEAQAYCKWRGGHLPTEAQWEKAAAWNPDQQAPREFPWGSDVLDPFYLNYQFTRIGDTAAVASYPNGRSFYGVADLAGNVAEWVYDWYSANFYGVSPFANPIGPIEGTERVYRGGSYNSTGAELRTPSRQSLNPGSRSEAVGFRCAHTPNGDPTAED